MYSKFSTHDITKILSIKFNKLVGIRQLEGMEINFSFTSKQL